MEKCIELKNKFISKNRMKQYKSIDEYFKNFIQPQHQSKIDISIKLLKLEKKKVEQDNILAELSFGFFVTFFKAAYKNYLRYNNLKQIFPNLPSSKNKSVNRHFIFAKLNNIRLFRNKVFHHDKIIGKIEYQNMMNEIYEILSYFDKEIVHITKDLNK